MCSMRQLIGSMNKMQFNWSESIELDSFEIKRNEIKDRQTRTEQLMDRQKDRQADENDDAEFEEEEEENEQKSWKILWNWMSCEKLKSFWMKTNKKNQ